MQYLGSKNRLSKEILPIIEKERQFAQAWVEPFVGGANMIDKVGGVRIAGEINEYLVALWKDLQEGRVMPTTITEEEYYRVKENKDEDKALTAFVGFLCSFGGKWFGGYAKNSKGDNYADRGSRVLQKQIEKLKDVDFTNCSYDEIEIPPMSLIYCDPPYKGTTKYKDDFDHEKFYQWCRDRAKEGHTVFVSEYSAPDDFTCVWEKEVKTVLDKNRQDSFRTERLFTI